MNTSAFISATPLLSKQAGTRPAAITNRSMNRYVAKQSVSSNTPASISMVASPIKAPNTTTLDPTTSPVTLTRFIIEQAMLNVDMDHLQDMQSLMAAIQLACKKISSMVHRAGITNLTGLQEGGGSVNIQGEEQKKLDVLSNEVLKNALKYSGKMGIVASEEEDKPVLVDEVWSGNYIAVFDPLDGSSNIDAGIATGTIFGIFQDDATCLNNIWEDEITDKELQCMTSTMQPGTNLICSGYCMYSSACVMVLTFGNGVFGFTLDPQIGEFILTHPNIKIPEDGAIYSFNEANEPAWDPVLKQYVQNLKTGNNPQKKKYSARYIGSMVADVHRTLLYGGVFGYPSDSKNKNGKLRLMYECAPISFIVEQAGGISTTGKERVLDIIPKDIHERRPLILGSKNDVQYLLDLYKEHGL